MHPPNNSPVLCDAADAQRLDCALQVFAVWRAVIDEVRHSCTECCSSQKDGSGTDCQSTLVQNMQGCLVGFQAELWVDCLCCKVRVLCRCGGLVSRLRDDSSQPNLRGHVHKRPPGLVEPISLALLRVETSACPDPRCTTSSGAKSLPSIHLAFHTSPLDRLAHLHGSLTPLPHDALSHARSVGGSTCGRPRSSSLNHRHDNLHTYIYITIRERQYLEPRDPPLTQVCKFLRL